MTTEKIEKRHKNGRGPPLAPSHPAADDNDIEKLRFDFVVNFGVQLQST
jgi:hypothetical protein